MSSKDNLGDRIKKYEQIETTNRLIPMLPTIIRLDGRSFSKYTKKFSRPFDNDMMRAMVETTKYLVKESNAVIGYTQSDEITLILYNESSTSDILFKGKKFKLLSNLASMASVKFYQTITSLKPLAELPATLPSFDCRLFQVPSKMEAWNALLWRVQDATRNSVQMLAQSLFSHKSLQGLNNRQLLDRMLNDKNVNWNDLDNWKKEGTFVRNQVIVRDATEAERQLSQGLGELQWSVTRSSVEVIDMPSRFNQIFDRIEWLFPSKETLDI